MYCKYCGSRIASDATKCVSCGSNIDLNDGGQSFFDDNELDAWQSDSMMRGPQTSMPKTEMREPLSDNTDFEKNYEKAFAAPQVSTGTRASRSHARSRKKKNILDYLNLSSSNKLIIFCIASALAIVLLVVAIIAVLNSGKETTDENASQSNTSGFTQQVEGNDNNLNTDNSQQTTTTPPNAETRQDNPPELEQEKVEENKTEIKDVKIFDKDGKEIAHPVSAFISEKNILYVSLDKILKHEGYKNGRPNGNDRNRIIYEHKTSGKVIEIEKETNKIWITEPGEAPETKYLNGNNFNVKDDTYIPIKSFLVQLGYDKDKVKWEEKDKTLYFSK